MENKNVNKIAEPLYNNVQEIYLNQLYSNKVFPLQPSPHPVLSPRQVLTQTETFLQQLLVRAVALLPQWRVAVQKCKAVEMVLNLCSPSVTDKCLIAEAWCPVTKLPELQSALREGGVSDHGGGAACTYVKYVN